MPTQFSIRNMLISLVLISACVQSARAGDEEKPAQVETRVYDIRSLLLEVPDYRATFSDLRSDDLYGPPVRKKAEGVFGQDAASAQTPSRAETRQRNVDAIIEIIETAIAPESWMDNGGDPGSIRQYAGQLIVTQTTENLSAIERLIGLLKAARSATVRVEVWFVQVSTAAYERHQIAPLLWKEELGGLEFLKMLDDNKDVLEAIRVTVSGFDGQRVFASAGTQVNAVVGATAMVAASSSAFEPLVRQLVDGVTLEVQPVIDSDRKSVLLDLRASIGDLDLGGGKESAPENVLAAGSSAPPYRVAHFAGSFAAPLGWVFLAGSAPYDDERDVLLFVYATAR